MLGRTAPTLALALALGSSCGSDTEAEFAALRDEARAKVPRFAEALKGELLAAMEAGGPARAMAVCNARAPAIAEAASDGGWRVGRTSTKLRNPSNAPDAWESETLAQFEARLAAGEDVQALERAEFVTAAGGRVFRYAKAIPLGGECLACHGASISSEVEAMLADKYPQDRATGYAAGDLRGMFSIEKRVE